MLLLLLLLLMILGFLKGSKRRQCDSGFDWGSDDSGFGKYKNRIFTNHKNSKLIFKCCHRKNNYFKQQLIIIIQNFFFNEQ